MTAPTQSRYCWQCGGSLRGVSVIITDQIGNQHHVHKACATDAEEDVRQITAQCLGKSPHMREVKNSDES